MDLPRLLLLLFLVAASGCTTQPEAQPGEADRHASLPPGAVKMSPKTDLHPPTLHSQEYEQPTPFDPVNTAGAEDSPFIPEGRQEMYFFFTPDASIPVEKQLLDGVTGIWISRLEGGEWQEPERVLLQDPGRLSLDGCQFVRGNEMLFCTAREGYTGLRWFSAEFREGKWAGWEESDFPKEMEVGELHIWENELYYHSERPGSEGLDIWLSRWDNGWSEPRNLGEVNSPDSEGWPFLTPDGQELWFTRRHMGTPAVFRSRRAEGGWQEPEMIVSQFAGEPTLDSHGNLYFVHHYYEKGAMLEADIYVAYSK